MHIVVSRDRLCKDWGADLQEGKGIAPARKAIAPLCT